MTRKEFIEKFKNKDGSFKKVRINIWRGELKWYQPLYLTNESVFGTNEKGDELVMIIDNYWEEYKEPKPKVKDPREGMVKVILVHKTPFCIREEYWNSKKSAELYYMNKYVELYEESDFI